MEEEENVNLWIANDEQNERRKAEAHTTTATHLRGEGKRLSNGGRRKPELRDFRDCGLTNNVELNGDTDNMRARPMTNLMHMRKKNLMLGNRRIW